MKPACVSACPSKALISGPEDEVIAEGERRVARYAERLGHDYVLYGKDKINRVVGRLGWVSIAARQDAKHYDLFAYPAKATMIARDVFKIGGAVGTAGVVAGVAFHGLYLFAKRKDQVKAAEKQTEEVPNE
jgi:formate dehydrogenase iron-sulfur subunit